MDAATSVEIELIYIGSAINLRSRIGDHLRSWRKRKNGEPDSNQQMCPAETCATDDGRQIKVSYAKTEESEALRWESELHDHYFARHEVKPGYRTLAGDWCRGNKANLNERWVGGHLEWSPFEEYADDLRSRLPHEPGVYRISV